MRNYNYYQNFPLLQNENIPITSNFTKMEVADAFSPADLYLISEKSIWKNQVQRTLFSLPV